MGTKKLAVLFGGKVHELRVCFSEERATELLERWPDQLIALERVYEHESPSTLDQRSHLVERVCKRAGVKLQLNPKLPHGEAVRAAFQALYPPPAPDAPPALPAP